jgi:ribosomal protein RSM22 (predicted rRNA methylase)
VAPSVVALNTTAASSQDIRDDDDDEENGIIYNEDDDEDDDDDMEEQPWKTLLDMPGRAAWRVAEHEQRHHDESRSGAASSALRHAQNAVLEHGKASWYSTSSNKHLLKTLGETSALHRSLANRRERERLRAHRNQPLSPPKNSKGGGGGAENGDDPKNLVYYGPIETLASVKHRLYPNYAVTRRVLREAKSLVGIHQPLNPKRVLDFGMGCGSASAAALDVFSESIEWIHGIDASETMRDGSQRFLQEFIQHSHNDSSSPDVGSGAESMPTMRRPPPRITHAAHLSSSSSHSSGSSSGRYFDLCLFCYTAVELPHNASTLSAAALLWEKLNPNGGILVMIEPGTPDGFSSIRQVRNMLLDCSPPKSCHTQRQDRTNNDERDCDNEDEDENETLEECHILAPCTHNRACPMERSTFSKPLGKGQSSQTQQDVIAEEDEDNDEDADVEEDESIEHDGEDEVEEGDRRKGYCSFVHAMPSAGGHNKSEKFSYLVAQKRTRGMNMSSPERHKMTMANDEDDNDDAELFCFDNISLSELLDQMLQKKEPTPMHNALNRQAARLGAKFLDSDQDDLGLEFVRGDANRSSFGRIIHAPKKKKAHVLIDCCSNGRIVRHKIPKSMSQRAPGIYAAARKSRWGGLWLGSKHSEDMHYRHEDKSASYKNED